MASQAPKGSASASSGITMRDAMMHSNPEISDYAAFIWVGGTLYKWSNKEPKLAFAQGFTKVGTHNDPVVHITKQQGVGSRWISCSLVREATGDYGKYCYEIELTHPHTKALDANLTVETITKHQNPFSHQQEVCIFKSIRPDEVTAVWMPIDNPKMRHDPKVYDGLLFAERYDRMTRGEFMRS